MAAIRPPIHGNGRSTYSILPGRCTECVGYYSRPRCVAICPAGCIETDADRLEDHNALVRKWHALALGEVYEASVPGSPEPAEETGEVGA